MIQLETTPPATLDMIAIDSLVTSCGDGGEEFVAGLLETFFEDAPRLVANLRRGLSDGDTDEVRRSAHTLKSHGMTFGSPFLAHVSRELEVLGRDGVLDGAESLLDEVVTEFERARVALEAVRRELLGSVRSAIAA